MNQGTPSLSSEIKAYNEIRFRLLRMARDHPGILNVHIARGDRMCRSCKGGPVREYATDAFFCVQCRYTWNI